jgi:N-methylhydantoinase A
MLRLSADVGGTFTDLVLIDDASNVMHSCKVSSLPGSGDAIVKGIEIICSQAGVKIDEIDLFLHSFTIATNAWLTRTGADVLLLVTDGYRDILEIADQRRPDLYNLATQKPLPLLDRSQIATVDERTDAFGQLVLAVTDKEADRIVQLIKERSAGIPDAVAISFLFSYLNSDNEQRITDAIRRHFPDIPVYISSVVNPKIHEYARANTTAAAAYVGPAVRKYTEALESQVAAAGLRADILYMRSDGGSCAPDDARANPANLLLSGPAGGVVAGTQTGELLGIDNLVTFDMGGTSADFAVIANRRSSVARARQIDGLPLRVPTLDIKAISAGGGSIGHVDPGGALKVGPASAGSLPGPAAYGLGGQEATLTDALLVLGYLDAGSFADDSIELSQIKAEAVLVERIASPMALTVTDAALGMVSIATANMAGAIRVISIERGQDLREFALLAFGGAGGVFAPFLLRELQMREVVIPPTPGVFAALGLQFADVRHDVQLAFSYPLATLTSSTLSDVLSDTIDSLRTRLNEAGFREDDAKIEVTADMRYVGQHHELNIQLPFNAVSGVVEIKGLTEKFSDTHETAYGYSDSASPVEITGLRIDAVGKLTKPTLPEIASASRKPEPSGYRRVSLSLGQPSINANIYQRADLSFGDMIVGPAIIEQMDTTTLILDNQQAEVSAYGFLRITELNQSQDDI